jgi:hypothetical protein
MFFETFENDIKNRLVAKVGSGITVEVLPEKQSDFATPFDKGKISVCYKMSDFDKPKSTGHTVQQEDMQAELVIQARNLRGVNGVYDIFNKARLAVVGFMPTHCGRVYGVSFKFEERTDAVWTYVFTIAARSEMVMLADNVVEPGITEITHVPSDQGFGSITVP